MQWCHFLYYWHHLVQTPVLVLHHILIILTKEMQWSHRWGHWNHMMMMPVESHGQKSHIASPFDHLDLTSGVMSLIMLMESWHWHMTQKVIMHLILVILTKQMQCCHWRCHWYHITEMSCCIFFWSSGPYKCNGTIDDPVSIMFHWHQHQWHYMTKTLFCTLL